MTSTCHAYPVSHMLEYFVNSASFAAVACRFNFQSSDSLWILSFHLDNL